MKTIKKGDRGEEVKVLQRALNLYTDGIFGSLTEEAVKTYQKANGLTADGVVGPKTWEKLGIKEDSSINLKTNKRTIKEIIVHCTATPEGKDYTVNQVRQWHKARGWSDIGYHFLIYRDGTVHAGRDINLSGAHCSGHNTYSIGVCYVGGLAKDNKTPKDTRTMGQKIALTQLLKELKKAYPNAKIYGHRDFTNQKACPSFDAKTEYKDI